MRLIALSLILLVSFVNQCLADEYVNGYSRSNGTYVQGHYKTDSDNTVNNNYSTQGNTNPYTGTQGTKPREYGSYNSNPSNYQSNGQQTRQPSMWSNE